MRFLRLNRLIELGPENANAYYNRGVAYAHQNKYRDAALDFDHVLTLDPENSDALYLKGVACINFSRYEDALSSFTQTLLKTEHPASFFYRGIALTKLAGIRKQLNPLNGLSIRILNVLPLHIRKE